jgi:hypothetical protein
LSLNACDDVYAILKKKVLETEAGKGSTFRAFRIVIPPGGGLAGIPSLDDFCGLQFSVLA